MIDFEYYNPAKIVFGEHSEQKLKSLLATYGVKSLQLVYSGDFIKTLGIYDVIKAAVADGTLFGAITQAPVAMGAALVQLCYDAANGVEVSDVDTGCQWYTAENMDSEEIAQNLYD